MKLLITGACGHIGSYIVEHVIKSKDKRSAINR